LKRNSVGFVAAVAVTLLAASGLSATQGAGAAATAPQRAARPARVQASSERPKLAVLIMVDQMRADYVEHFKNDWTHGLKRLVTQGAWFRRAAYPYLTTVTCAGHATVGTGAFPRTHGIIQNTWWDREHKQLITCTQDANVHEIGYGVSVDGGDSAAHLMMPTFADVLRSQRKAHVVTLSLKARSAIMPAGHGGDAVTWLDDAGDGWTTSSAFAEQPVPAVKAFIDANPLDADFGKTWTRALPAARYSGPDDAVGEAPPKGWTHTFPHELKGSTGAPDADFRQQWMHSPYADAYLGRFAAALVESLALGKHGTTDMLSVSFSSPDLVGHGFGPRSQEMQDMYMRLDATIGTLLDRLDVLVGKGQYVVALTADHGVTPLPEQLTAAGEDGGRISQTAVRDAVQNAAQSALGSGTYVARENYNDIYLEPGMYAKLAAKPGALQAVVNALLATPGIAKVYRAEEIRGAVHSSDRFERAAALSYFPGRSGDLILVPKPGWEFSTSGAMHGTPTADDQRVPILLFGFGIRPGAYLQAVTPADVAPTLAAISGITLPQADGHALTEALRAAPRRTTSGGGQPPH
jgi:predicted AlkP superfamily pyrophosphatase or phosphodiesterase